MGVEGATGAPVLRQNSPNPFNPRTEIAFGLQEPSECRLTVYNVSGRLVATLLDELRGPGTHRVEWDGRTDEGIEVGTGVYLYRLETDRGTSERKMLLLK
jgi:flagellar hook assembly protein FlgD